MNRYKKLVQERADLINEAKGVFAQAEQEDRDLTIEERARDDEINARLEELAKEIAREERRREWERTVAQPISAGQITEVKDLATERSWESFGHFLQAVANAGMPGGVVDPRLYRGASGASSGVPSEGGYLVGTDFTTALLESTMQRSVLLPYCRAFEIGANSDGLEATYIKETSRATGSRWGGVQVYRRAEAATVTATQPKFGMFSLRLEDLMGLAYATDRLLRDATALQSVLSDAFASEMAFKIDDEIIRGNGAGEFLGLLAAGGLVTVSKESAQAADTVVFENVAKMRRQMYAPSRPRAIWLINYEVEMELSTMALVVGTGGVPVYLPASGINVDGYDRLYGRPVIILEQCSALGDLGDIFFADLSQYIYITKGGIVPAESVHVRFIYGERAFRWIYSINGAPAPRWESKLTPYKGAADVSPFVTLQAR